MIGRRLRLLGDRSSIEILADIKQPSLERRAPRFLIKNLDLLSRASPFTILGSSLSAVRVPWHFLFLI